jgi:hypothetical protein
MNFASSGEALTSSYEDFASSGEAITSSSDVLLLLLYYPIRPNRAG